MEESYCREEKLAAKLELQWTLKTRTTTHRSVKKQECRSSIRGIIRKEVGERERETEEKKIERGRFREPEKESTSRYCTAVQKLEGVTCGQESKHTCRWR